jgi:hypothetical protein
MVGLAFALVFRAVTATAPTPAIPVGIVEVRSGGEWHSSSARGHFRVLVQEQGFEHIWSRVFLQWIADSETHDKRPAVLRSLEITQASETRCSLGVTELRAGTLQLDGQSSFSGAKCGLHIELGAPGTYRVVP